MQQTSVRKYKRTSQSPTERLFENQLAIEELLRRLDWLHASRDAIVKEMHLCQSIDTPADSFVPSSAETSTTDSE